MAASRSAWLRRWAGVLLPVFVGLVVLVAAAQFPRSLVQGNPATGPLGLGGQVAAPDGLIPSARWKHGGDTILVTVRPRTPCVVQVEGVTSTAPGRIEVAIRIVAHAKCTGVRREQTFPVQKPIVINRHQAVHIAVGNEVIRLLPYGEQEPVPTYPRVRWPRPRFGD